MDDDLMTNKIARMEYGHEMVQLFQIIQLFQIVLQLFNKRKDITGQNREKYYISTHSLQVKCFHKWYIKQLHNYSSFYFPCYGDQAKLIYLL